jgi:hypothetical protein
VICFKNITPFKTYIGIIQFRLAKVDSSREAALKLGQSTERRTRFQKTVRLQCGPIRTLAGEFPLEDIYNMDETGLLWRSAPNRGLAINPRPGI